MKKEIVWVDGLSAAGKQTFIKKVAEDKAVDLLTSFGWQDSKVAVSKKSLEIIGALDDKDVEEKRNALEKEVVELAKNHDIILIKLQSVDVRAKRPEKLQSLLPDFKHKVICLRVKAKDMAERLRAKPWWDAAEDPFQWVKEEQVMVEEELDSLAQDFQVITVDASKGSDYRIIGVAPRN